MSAMPQWALLHECATVFEAEILRSLLEAAEIPVLVQGQQPGIFGAGFQGPIVGGVQLLVPSTALEEAREIVQDHLD
ncbi:MAG: putative prokaryotic signal transducing protein [Gemmatimonadota bacterium]